MLKKPILLLSRKDIQHPKAGGAEVVIHKYAQGLVQGGYQVTQIAPLFSGAKKEELIDGIQIKRMFSIHTIYFCFWQWFLLRNKERYDLIIDHAGGIPLLSPLYIWKTPIVFFTHHIGTTERKDYFLQWLGVAWLGRFFGRLYTFFIIKLYRKKTTITVSQGTAYELEKLGFTNICILPNTPNYPRIAKTVANKQNMLTTVGRIVPNKQFAHALYILEKLHNNGLIYTLNIVGDGQDINEVTMLKELVIKHGLEKYVRFTGKISTNEIIELWDSSRYGLITSDKEGFGMTALEGNCRGVPMLGYAIPGVDEVIHHDINGYLVKKNNREQMANLIIQDTELKYTHLVKNTIEYIQHYPTRDNNIEKFNTLIADVSQNPCPASSSD